MFEAQGSPTNQQKNIQSFGHILDEKEIGYNNAVDEGSSSEEGDDSDEDRA